MQRAKFDNESCLYFTDGGYVYRYRDGRLEEAPQRKSADGYSLVSADTETRGAVSVHRKVAQLFLQPPEDGDDLVLHINDDKNNNAAVNLSWGTHFENFLDAIANDVLSAAVRDHIKPQKQSIKSVKQMKELRESGWSMKAIADHYKTTVATVRSYLNNQKTTREEQHRFADFSAFVSLKGTLEEFAEDPSKWFEIEEDGWLIVNTADIKRYYDEVYGFSSPVIEKALKWFKKRKKEGQ